MLALVDEHHRGNNKPKNDDGGQGWRRLTRIANDSDKLETFMLNFSDPQTITFLLEILGALFPVPYNLSSVSNESMCGIMFQWIINTEQK